MSAQIKNALMLIFVITIGACSVFSNKDEVSSAKITYSKNLSLAPDKIWPDKELKKAFSDYWGLRFAKKPDQLFKMEAPYFQEMANFERYTAVSKSLKNFNEVEIRADMIRVSQKFVRIPCTLKLNSEKGTEEVAITDEWVYVGEKWYHVWKDPLLFPS